MRAVFQLPASMTSVVDAPRAVSSDASPTRPLCAVTRASMPAARAGGVGGAKGADRLRGAVFEIPHVGGVPLLICFRARLNGVTCMGGGLWTSAAIPLALAYHPVWVLGISAGAVALWLLVWALLFRGRLGLG